MNNYPIGIFDSGVGGLSVFAELIKLMPDEYYIYFGDTLNLPYGNKSKEELLRITSDVFNFFESKNVKAVVMACNTTSAITYDVLKDKYKFKIYPIVQRAVKRIVLENYNRIGVFATQATINSHSYSKEIKKYKPDAQIFETACPAWVNIVENRLQNEPESIQNIKTQLSDMLKNNVEKIILGCTHYPYLLENLKKFAPENLFINPAKCFAQDIFQDLKQNNMFTDNLSKKREFYVSASPDKFKEASKLFYEVNNAQEISISKSLINKI